MRTGEPPFGLGPMGGPVARPATSPTVAGETGLTPRLPPNSEVQGLRGGWGARLGLTWQGRRVGLLASRMRLSLPRGSARVLLTRLVLVRLLLVRMLLACLPLACLLLLLLLPCLLLLLLLLISLPVRRPLLLPVTGASLEEPLQFGIDAVRVYTVGTASAEASIEVSASLLRRLTLSEVGSGLQGCDAGSWRADGQRRPCVSGWLRLGWLLLQRRDRGGRRIDGRERCRLIGEFVDARRVEELDYQWECLSR